ncbi:urea transporter [Paraburkholderia sp. GAS199]|uniref:urea transporter n=1 Tax=Paraburkholderia sp. GAS199 TaxID=3035126 RepID=UPI003D1F58FE
MYVNATEAGSAASRTFALPTSLDTLLCTLLRSLGQIVLQGNAFTGACLIAAWLLFDPRLACAALVGAVAANVSAVLAGCDEADTRAGLHGFNGALAGLAAFSFVADNATATAVAILAATGTAWLQQPWARGLQARGLGVFSSPCLIVTWIWLALMKPASPASLIAPVVAPDHVSTAAQVGGGWLAGFAQIGFASGALPGLLVLTGIAAASRRHALFALLGAALASAAHVLLGAPMSSLGAGLLGFNGALTAIALSDCGIGITLGGVALSVALQAAATSCGLPAMTAPFVLATWSVQWCMQWFAKRAAEKRGKSGVQRAAGRRAT